MNVGIIGSGQVAQSLARGFTTLGHQVKLGSRSPEKLSALVEELGGGASAGSFAEAAEFGEIGVVATLWSGTEHALELADDGARSPARWSST
jgi:predicted dinucleotide-binding enzyme